MRKRYPILEYDKESPNVIDPIHNVDLSIRLPQQCVLSFFGEAVKKKVESEHLRTIGSLIMESIDIPIYECVAANGKTVALLHILGGGPYAAGQIEKLHALGARKYIVCGGCGVLVKGSCSGQIYVPVSAVRDEGTSYHYVPPSREIRINEEVLNNISDVLKQKKIPFSMVKTWTTDAMYRETKAKIESRKKEGCHVVEMECASFYAVAEYKQDLLGQLLYAGDDLSGEIWKSREWKSNTTVRDRLLELSIDICSKM